MNQLSNVLLDYGNWNDWSDCSTSCGSGSHHRSRNVTVIVDITHSYTTVEIVPQPCNEDPCGMVAGSYCLSYLLNA